jgi:4a-hydroxytetrahydrobiopterin dehydratase
MKPRALDEATIRARLAAELPRWALVDGAISRSWRTGGWKATLMLATTIGHLAEVAWHHPDLALSYNRVTVRLNTHSVNGITALDFALAAQIEAVLGWRPAAGGVLDGTPTDPRHAYILDDEAAP